MGCGGGSDATKSASFGTATSGSAVSTGAGTASTGSGASSGVASSTGSTGPIGSSGAAKLAARLRAKGNFLIGMGNDLANDHNMDGAYTVGPTLDLHYAYLVGLPTQGGWPDWNPDGAFVNVLSTAAQAHGVTPMYSLYMMAADGDGNISVLTNDSFMSLYWQAAKLLFQRIALIQGPAVVHIEPDFWGYVMQKGRDGTAHVHIAAPPP